MSAYLECPNCKKLCPARLEPTGWVYYCARCWKAQDYDLRNKKGNPKIQPGPHKEAKE